MKIITINCLERLATNFLTSNICFYWICFTYMIIVYVLSAYPASCAKRIYCVKTLGCFLAHAFVLNCVDNTCRISSVISPGADILVLI